MFEWSKETKLSQLSELTLSGTPQWLQAWLISNEGSGVFTYLHRHLKLSLFSLAENALQLLYIDLRQGLWDSKLSKENTLFSY